MSYINSILNQIHLRMRTLISIIISITIILNVNSHSLNDFTKGKDKEELSFLQDESNIIKDEEKTAVLCDKEDSDLSKLIEDFEANDYNKVIIKKCSSHYTDYYNLIISSALKTLSNLTHFEYHSPSIAKFELILDALANFNNLTYLEFSELVDDYNHIDPWNENRTESFIRLFNNKTKLKYLNLLGWNIDSSFIGKALVKVPNLTSFLTSRSKNWY